MSKAAGKTGKKVPTGKEQKAKAKRLYLEKLGMITDSQLARVIGAHRVTVGKWRKEDNWDLLAEQARRTADKKVTEKLATKYVDQFDAGFEELFANMRLLCLAARKKMLLLDERGRPILDATGHPKMNPKMTSSDMRNYGWLMAEYQRMMRLESGKSTENTATRVSGEMGISTQELELFNQAIDKIVAEGDAQGQQALMDFAKARQDIVECGSGGK